MIFPWNSKELRKINARITFLSEEIRSLATKIMSVNSISAQASNDNSVEIYSLKSEIARLQTSAEKSIGARTVDQILEKRKALSDEKLHLDLKNLNQSEIDTKIAVLDWVLGQEERNG